MTTSNPPDEGSIFDIHDPEGDEEIAPPSQFAIQLRPSLEKMLNALVKAELVEFDEDKRELLYAEMTESAGKTRHPKAIFKAVVYALIESENVEEVFGSDPELLKVIKAAVEV